VPVAKAMSTPIALAIRRFMMLSWCMEENRCNDTATE
jgi:hypothetical protein